MRNALVCEKICNVDNTPLKYIFNPYTSQPTAAVQALTGTYSVSAWTTTDDTLDVNNEFVYGEHVFDFETKMNNYNLITERMDEIANAIATSIDRFVLNNLCEDGTGAYTTPAGGFTTAGNIATIFSNLVSKVAGYSEMYKGMFLVLENTDITGLLATQVASGFSYADMALKNGFLQSYMGVDIYVVRTGTFASETLGTTTYTNSGHRVFGIKNVATYASPRSITYEEKSVSGKTGKEIAASATVGFKLWTQKAGLIVDITLA